MTERIAVVIETGAKRTFAGAVDWPGWSRAAKSEDEAIDSLLRYAGRYRAVLVAGAVPGAMPPSDAAGIEVHVVERVAGSSGTDFGVPSHPPGSDALPLDEDEASRLVAVLEAAWAAFDAAAESAEGRELRLGPRGGGRDLTRIRAHVREADASYLTQLGVRAPRIRGADEIDMEQAVRRRAAEVIRAHAAGTPIDDTNQVQRKWTPRVYVRRAAWHALDHAWEIEDRRID
jgi:hypothetical protein